MKIITRSKINLHDGMNDTCSIYLPKEYEVTCVDRECFEEGDCTVITDTFTVTTNKINYVLVRSKMNSNTAEYHFSLHNVIEGKPLDCIYMDEDSPEYDETTKEEDLALKLMHMEEAKRNFDKYTEDLLRREYNKL